MRNLQNLLFVLGCFLLIPSMQAQTGVINEISMAIKTGNAKAVARYFDSNVELTLPDEEGFFSKAQSEQVLKKFFQQYPPKDFKVMHQGESDGDARYVIGTLTTQSNQEFRTLIYLKKEGDKFLVHQLKFTNDSAN
jgi:Domain of unknown function (DUF4783)